MVEMMDGLPPSRTLRGRKGVCSGGPGHINVRSYRPGGITDASSSTHLLETYIDLALLNTMVMKVNKAHGT